MNVTQTSYQAEENHNITLEWTFTNTTDTSPDSLFIFCEMKTDHKASVLFELFGGVVVPESQDQQFVGRVQWDKDVLRDGRLRLHVSRLRTEDSGWYLCDVRTNYGVDLGECWLNVSGKLVENFINRFNSAAFFGSIRTWRKVLRMTTIHNPSLHSHSIWVLLFGLFTAVRDWPEHERPNTDKPERLNTASRGRISLYCVLGLTATVVVVWFVRCRLFITVCPRNSPAEDLRKAPAQQDQRKQFYQVCKWDH